MGLGLGVRVRVRIRFRVRVKVRVRVRREECGDEPLLEGVDQEEGRRDQSDAVCRGMVHAR